MAKSQAPRRTRKPVKLKPAASGDLITYYQLPDQAQTLLSDVCEEMRLLALLATPRTPQEHMAPSLPLESLANCFTRAFLNLQNVLSKTKPMTEV